MKRKNKIGILFPVTTIDWPWLVSGYNRMFHTDFASEKSLYLGLLPTLSPRKIADRLGVSTASIYRRLDYYNIPRRHKQSGANHIQAPERDAFLAISPSVMAEMTMAEIVKETKINAGYCSALMKIHGRTYKHVVNQYL